MAISIFIFGFLYGSNIQTDVLIKTKPITHKQVKGIPDIPKDKTLRLEDVDSGLYIDINDETLSALSYSDKFEVDTLMYMLSEDYKNTVFNKLYYIFNKDEFFDNMLSFPKDRKE